MSILHLHTVRDVLDLSVLWAPTARTLSETSNDHTLCCKPNHGNILVQLLHCLSLSYCQLESTLPPAAQLLLSQSQQEDLVGHYLRLSNDLERPSCEPLYATNTLHLKQETFLYEYPFHWVVLPTKKKRNRFLLFGGILPKRGHHFWLLKLASENAYAHMLPRLSWSWTVLLPSDAYRKPITTTTATLLPFLTYLLTLSRICNLHRY
jgi:hypothetical protein